MNMQNPPQQPAPQAASAADPTPREEFARLIRATTLLLLRIDRPYLALCLRQFELMALAVWPEADPPRR